MRVEGNTAYVDAAADLGRTVTFCAKHDLGGMEGLIGVPGTVGGALRMNAGAYGTQIGTYVREVELYRAATGEIETLRGNEIRFEYRHTSFAPDDIMLAVKLELPSKPLQRNSSRDSHLQRKAPRQPAAQSKKRGLHFQESAGRFRRTHDRRAGPEGPSRRRRQGQRPPRQFFRQRRPCQLRRHARADRRCARARARQPTASSSRTK